MKRKILVSFVLVFCLGIIADRVVSFYLISPVTVPAPIREKGYKYIAPLLYCRYPNQDDNHFIKTLRSDLNDYIDEENSNGDTQTVSVFFHEPTSGKRASINKDEKYTLASLMKVPILMMVYKQAENNPSLLSTKIDYNGSFDSYNKLENIKPTEAIQKGHSYTVDEILTRMIIYSDNSAANLLASHMKEEVFNENLKLLNFDPISNIPNTETEMTVGKYAAFFRILFNSTYLDHNMSEKALALLTKTNFTSGIVAGVPKNITVAHKFGERAYENSNIKQLHDCGIVYLPNHPYLLCIMTKGYDYDKLETVIKTISKKTYDVVNSAYK